MKTSVGPMWTLNQLFAVLFPLSSSDAPEEKVAGERGEESPVGGPKGPAEDLCETELGTEADVEDEDVDVVRGIDEAGVSGYESEGFTLSEILRRKRNAERNVSKGVNDTSHLAQGELSNLQRLPITFLLEFPGWLVTEFY